jgi:iron complex outermembrane receptor protein
VGLEARYKGWSIRPELAIAAAQRELFTTETPTAGYTVANLNASYTIAQQHLVHVLSASFFNLGDRLYRNHLSFIKDLAPEIGRGVRFTYTVRFF